MLSARTLSLVAPFALISFATPPAKAQHFSKPPAVDLAVTPVVGTPTSTIPRPTTSFGSVVSGGWLYVMGGYTGRPHDYYREGQSADFYRINLLSPSHIEALPNGQSLQSNPLETWNGRVIVTGGMVAHNTRGEDQVLESLRTVRAFDPLTGSWSDLPDLPEGRSSHDTAVVGSTLYVIGGWSIDRESGDRVWPEAVLALDLATPDEGWSTVATASQRRALATVAVGDQIVAIGGITSDRKLTKRVEVLDTNSGNWTAAPDYPGAAFGVAADVHDGTVFASGSDGTVYSWEPGLDEWSPIAALTFPRFFHQIAADEAGDLRVIGGTSRGVRPVHLETVPLASTSRAARTPVIAHWRIPSPAAAKNRQGMFLDDGWLYAFGGNNSTGQHNFEPDNFLADGFRLSISGLQWDTTAPLPLARQTIQVAHSPDGKRVLAFGGFGHDGEIARTFAEGFEYSTADDEWRALGQVLPTPRSQFGLVEHDGTYWAFGGLDYDSRRDRGDQFRHLTPILRADADSRTPNFVDAGINLLQPRRAFAGAKMDGKYYLVSGMRENFQIVEECEEFDFASETIASMPAPSRPRLSATLVPLNGRLYLAGGSSPRENGQGLEPNPAIEEFNPQTGTWRTVVDEIPISPRHMRAMPFRGRLLLVSSHTDVAQMTNVVMIDPTDASTPTAMPTTTASASPNRDEE